MAILLPALTAGIVILAGGGDAYWVSVPAALLAATAANRRAGLACGALVVLAAALPGLISSGRYPLPSTAAAILIPLASLTVLFSLRSRLEREREALRRSALSDPLTGIANRRSLQERIEYEISRHGRTGHSFALVMIDLDGFKSLNDRFGHAAGDDLLREAAAALRRTLRAQDTAARIGGDEFCVLAPETHAGGIAQLETRITQAVGAVTAGVEMLSASAGTAIFPRDGTTAETLMAAADAQLLGAKRVRTRVPGDYRRAA